MKLEWWCLSGDYSLVCFVFDSGQSVYSFFLLHCEGVVLALKFSVSPVIVQAELSSVPFCTRKSFTKFGDLLKLFPSTGVYGVW